MLRKKTYRREGWNQEKNWKKIQELNPLFTSCSLWGELLSKVEVFDVMGRGKEGS